MTDWRVPVREGDPAQRASFLVAIPYMGLIAVSVLYPYFKIVRLPWYTMHAAYVMIIGFAFLWVFVTGNLTRVKRAGMFVALFGGLYLVLLSESLAIWVTSQDGMSLIRRGGATLAYQILGILAVASSYVLFGRRAIVYTFWGMVAGNALLALNAVYTLGLGDFVSQLLDFYKSLGAEDTAASKAMEVHDLTFAFGLFVLYFALFSGKGAGNRFCLVVAIGFFLLGWKRIAIPGLVLAGAYVVLMRRFPTEKARRWTGWFGVGLIAIAFAYLVIIRTGLYAEICRRLEINTMGRVELLRFIEQYYDLKPTYMGYGIGFITRMMQDYIEAGDAVLNAAMSIHNDILARYIELGFLGFFAWATYLFYATARYLSKRWSFEATTIFFASLLYCFCTYLTDNTAGYYHINYCLRLFPLALALEERRCSAAVKLRGSPT